MYLPAFVAESMVMNVQEAAEEHDEEHDAYSRPVDLNEICRLSFESIAMLFGVYVEVEIKFIIVQDDEDEQLEEDEEHVAYLSFELVLSP